MEKETTSYLTLYERRKEPPIWICMEEENQPPIWLCMEEGNNPQFKFVWQNKTISNLNLEMKVIPIWIYIGERNNLQFEFGDGSYSNLNLYWRRKHSSYNSIKGGSFPTFSISILGFSSHQQYWGNFFPSYFSLIFVTFFFLA